MAEIQQSTSSGPNAARFIEFVMMQAQNASLFLGLIPNPQSGQPEVNLDLARMFIDQLAMIQEKTRGNLSAEETGVLRNALSNLQMAFFEVAQGGGKAGSPASGLETPFDEDLLTDDAPAPAAAAEPAPSPAPPVEQPESRKRFTKSYGS